MVKFANRGKSKPSKRKTLKIKYKIQRKVRQHKKKLKKQMKKMKGNSIRSRKSQKQNTLPNSFPFKTQILQHFKSQLPAQPQILNGHLTPSQWGLIALQNKGQYFKKDKDHLTKKYISNISKIFSHANLIIETLDARNIQICLSSIIKQQCQKKHLKHILVICKIDTISQKYLLSIKQKLNHKYQYCLFTTQQKTKNTYLNQLAKKIQSSKSGKINVVVVGKANTGKHTLIKQFMKSVKFHNQDYGTINDVHISDHVNMVDTPYKVQDDTGYPLFHVPSSVGELSIGAQEQQILKYLFIDNLKNHNDFLMHYEIQEYVSIDDMLKKIGKVNRIFGKGGMVNVAAVRNSVLTDWYSGKLNYIFQ